MGWLETDRAAVLSIRSGIGGACDESSVSVQEGVRCVLSLDSPIPDSNDKPSVGQLFTGRAQWQHDILWMEISVGQG